MARQKAAAIPPTILGAAAGQRQPQTGTAGLQREERLENALA
jgi:hypothetical protein